MMPLIYIASPYTKGDAFMNVKRQIDMAEVIANLGGVPLWPLSSAFWNMLHPHDWEFWIEQDKVLVSKCDALIRLTGESKGADIEVETAIQYNIPVFYAVYDLEKFIFGNNKNDS